MKRLVLLACVAVLLLCDLGPALAQTANLNSTAFPLGSNIMFPARSQRQTLRCFNPTTNSAATITYPSGLAIVLQPGMSLWETSGRVPSGQILATGTSTQTLPCEETY